MTQTDDDIKAARRTLETAGFTIYGPARPRITQAAKPGKLTYCDEDCTPEKCSETHDRRDVVCAIDIGD